MKKERHAAEERREMKNTTLSRPTTKSEPIDESRLSEDLSRRMDARLDAWIDARLDAWIDAWIVAQPEPRPSRSEAIRRLRDDEIERAIYADGAFRRPIPQSLPAAGSLAQSYFEEPRWWLSLVLAWIAFREVEAITTSYDDIRTLHFRVVMHGANGDALKEKAPLSTLLKRLKVGRIVAIGGDDTDLPAEYWDRIGYDQPWEAWPHVRFRRDEILSEFPAEPLSAPENVAVASTGAPVRVRGVRPLELEGFLANSADVSKTKPEVKTEAEAYFQGKIITTRAFDKAWAALPAQQKRRPGETDKTLNLRAKSSDG
jgi:hypothetical protein